VIPQLAAASRRSLKDFGIYRRDREFAAVLQLSDSVNPAPLPPWPQQAVPLGVLAVAPTCGALD
jgi:hypothetical protein